MKWTWEAGDGESVEFEISHHSSASLDFARLSVPKSDIVRWNRRTPSGGPSTPSRHRSIPPRPPVELQQIPDRRQDTTWPPQKMTDLRAESKFRSVHSAISPRRPVVYAVCSSLAGVGLHRVAIVQVSSLAVRSSRCLGRQPWTIRSTVSSSLSLRLSSQLTVSLLPSRRGRGVLIRPRAILPTANMAAIASRAESSVETHCKQAKDGLEG